MVSMMLYPCMFCVSLLMDLFVLCVCESFGETIRKICLDVFAILLLECYGLVKCCWTCSIG